MLKPHLYDFLAKIIHQSHSLLSDIMGQHRRMGESFNDMRRLSRCKILMKGEKKGEMVERERQSTCNWQRVER